ncbi:MAG TPA: helix-turn-helix transcriptional regulator [Candidatus Bathyarchaeia archaeon]|nr:helix-turn-helix transcriptional regulator [Candidatus Bathyarchaeia archaeon]
MKNLGEKIREIRENKDISLRELAKKLEISAAFLSDVELGRRYPSKKVLRQIALQLDVEPEELEKYDTRPPVEEIRRRVQADPLFGLALRKMIDKKISPEDLMKLVGKAPGQKKK